MEGTADLAAEALSNDIVNALRPDMTESLQTNEPRAPKNEDCPTSVPFDISAIHKELKWPSLAKRDRLRWI